MRFDVGDRVRSNGPRDFGVGTVVQACGRWGVQLYTIRWGDGRGKQRILSMPEEMLRPAADEECWSRRMLPVLARWRDQRAYRRWEKAVRVVGRRAVEIQAATGCSWDEAKSRASTLPLSDWREGRDAQDADLAFMSLRLVWDARSMTPPGALGSPERATQHNIR